VKLAEWGVMKKLSPVLKLALGLLALSFTTTIVRAEENSSKERKPSKATLEKYDADKDGQLNDEEKAKAKAGAREKAKQTREENLAKYDANKDGKLDETERATKKAEEDSAKATARADRDSRKAAKK
jgi:hypothetical protein